MRLGMSYRVAKTFFLSPLLGSFGFCSNRFRDFTHLIQGNLKSFVSAQYTLETSKLFRIPSVCQQGFAILSALGGKPLVLEISWMSMGF